MDYQIAKIDNEYSETLEKNYKEKENDEIVNELSDSYQENKMNYKKFKGTTNEFTDCKLNK